MIDFYFTSVSGRPVKFYFMDGAMLGIDDQSVRALGAGLRIGKTARVGEDIVMPLDAVASQLGVATKAELAAAAKRAERHMLEQS